jgi:hypothetical protein
MIVDIIQNSRLSLNLYENASTAEREVDVISVHCNENPIYVFLDWELRDLSLNFHTLVSVSDLYIPRISPHISCYFDGGNILINYIHMNMENWDCARTIPFLGIFVSNFRYWFFAE